jgi:chromosome condensin MukBEF MukE localization factor
MRRLFWLVMGVTIGVLVVRKLSQAAERLTPGSVLGNLADGLRDLAEAIGDFGADVRAAAAERESELRTGTGLDAPLPSRDGRALPGRPAAPAPRPAEA